MTNFEKIKEMQNEEDLGKWLYRRWEDNILHKHGDDVNCCDVCPCTDRCSSRNNGFARWLSEECDA